jgi:tetratricopeptide (TPR) repeat protein
LRLVIWPKRIFYLVVACCALILARQLQLTWVATLVLVLVPLVAIEGILRVVLRGRMRTFDHQFMQLLQSGRLDDLMLLYRRQVLLRLAAPRYYLLGKLGLAHSQRGQHRAAAAAYREALDDAPTDKRRSLALNLGHSLCEIGETGHAEHVYRAALDDGNVNVQGCLKLGQLIAQRGGDLDDAERYMRMGVEAARGGIARCELIHLLLARGKNEEAAQQLQQAIKELSGGDEAQQASLEKARAAVQAAGVDLADSAESDPLHEPER